MIIFYKIFLRACIVLLFGFCCVALLYRKALNRQ